ncbi:MAG: hypothetical protein EU536_02810 [Promethearchaeota archaeon]|nr:MAG: hypothetical protein EU536_02810 [Candidatus Lokiarchaeota archaeon]
MKDEKGYDDPSIESEQEPDALLEYIFVRRGFNLEQDGTLDIDYFYGALDIYLTGVLKNDDSESLSTLLPAEIQERANELVQFHDNPLDFTLYKFGVLEDDQKLTEFLALNDTFFDALRTSWKFVVIGRELEFDQFKHHQIFSQFDRFVHELIDEDIMDNYVTPHATVEFLFVEKAERQIEPINEDQGYIMAYINMFFTGQFANNNLSMFKALLEDELNFSVKESYFQNKEVDLRDYKFYLIDNEKNTREFLEMSEDFFEELMASLRNLLIVGKNFEIEPFKNHEIFLRWFDEYSNRQ